MSRISFKCDFKSVELQSLTLPVEVRKPNLALVAQTLTSQPVTLEPGVYHVTAKLPAGHELYNQITVEAGKDDTVILEPDPEDMSPDAWLEVEHYIQGQQAAAPVAERRLASVSWSGHSRGLSLKGLRENGDESLLEGLLEGLGAEAITAKLRAFSGNILQGSALVREASGWLQPLPAPAPGVAKFSCRPGAVNYAQLLQPQASPVNIALPLSPEESCQLVLTRQADGRLAIDVNLQHLAADTLLRYSEKGLLQQAAATTASNAFSAEQLLFQKMAHPIAASVGAYALLRFGEIERLHTWTENLKDGFAWLPDGISIRAEHLARIGQHAQALAALLELPARGLPIFSDGLSYAINRLRLYVSQSKADFVQQLRPQAEALLEQLQRFATFVDFHQPVLTFTGLTPDKPGDEPFEEDIDLYEGLDVAEHVG